MLICNRGPERRARGCPQTTARPATLAIDTEMEGQLASHTRWRPWPHLPRAPRRSQLGGPSAPTLCHDPEVPARGLSPPPHHVASVSGTHVDPGTGRPARRSALGRQVKPLFLRAPSNYQPHPPPQHLQDPSHSAQRGEAPVCLHLAANPHPPPGRPARRTFLEPVLRPWPGTNRARWERHSLFSQEETLWSAAPALGSNHEVIEQKLPNTPRPIFP